MSFAFDVWDNSRARTLDERISPLGKGCSEGAWRASCGTLLARERRPQGGGVEVEVGNLWPVASLA